MRRLYWTQHLIRHKYAVTYLNIWKWVIFLSSLWTSFSYTAWCISPPLLSGHNEQTAFNHFGEYPAQDRQLYLCRVPFLRRGVNCPKGFSFSGRDNEQSSNYSQFVSWFKSYIREKTGRKELMKRVKIPESIKTTVHLANSWLYARFAN